VPRLRAVPEDFLVEELPLYRPSGAGGHAWLEVEKRGRDTAEVAAEIAAHAGVDSSHVGWAGRKDRDAVARQWVSVPGLDPARATDLAGPGWRVLQAHRHDERLRVGELVGNRFVLRVREVTPAQAEAAVARLATLVARGLPNRFGAQRFGRDGNNVALGARLLRGEPVPAGRRQQRLYLSALQAAVFNEALARRPLPPDQLLDGDLALVHATGALLTFAVGDQPLLERLARFEVSPTGPIVGHKMRSPRGAARALERAACAHLGVPWVVDLPHLRGNLLPGGRRPLRARVDEALATPRDGELELRFRLPPGSYATVLAAELFPDGIAEGPATRPASPEGDGDSQG
jgi:tRNA pseudouridine13 synthase